MTQLFVNQEIKWEFYGVTGSTVTELLGLSNPPFNVNNQITINLTPGQDNFTGLSGIQLVGGISGNSLFISIANSSIGIVSGNVISDIENYIELDLLEDEPIRFNKRASVLEQPEIVASNYTNTFIVPHTAKNGEFFKSAFNVNSYSFDATKKIKSYINIDGSRFTTGDLRLNSVIKNDKLNRIEYEVIFIGEIGSFASTIGSKLMSDLDLSQYNHQTNYDNITKSCVEQLFGGAIIYPLVEWGYTYDNDNYPEQNTVSKWKAATSSTPETRGFTKAGNPLLQGQLKPIIKAKALFDRILKEAGFTYESKFINENNDLIKYLYHLSTGPDTSGPYIISGNLLCKYSPSSRSGSEIYVSDIELDRDFAYTPPSTAQYTWIMPNKMISVTYDPTFIINTDNKDILLPNFTTPTNPPYNIGQRVRTYFKIPSTGQYRLTIENLYLYYKGKLKSNGVEDTQFITIYVYVNGVSIDTQTGQFKAGGNQNPGSSPVINFSVSPFNIPNYAFPFGGGFYNFNKDDEVEIRLQRQDWDTDWEALYIDYNITTYSLYTNSPDFNFNSMFPANYKQSDFIKSINDKFKLIWEPDPENPKNFFIEPWVNWVKSGKKLDWTNKLNENIDIIVRPVFQTQPRTTIWKDQPETDIYNYQFQQEFKKGFGEIKSYSDIEIISGERTIQTNIAPIQVAPIGNSQNFLIPHIAKDSGDKVEPIEATPRFCFYNGLINNPIDIVSGLNFKWHLIDDTGSTSMPQTKYPLISNFSTFGISPISPYFDNNSFDISWNNVKQYWEPALNLEYGNGITSQTAYNVYWSLWYENTYNPYSRIIEAEFALDTNDIRDLLFNDRIWVKDAWYFPLNIKDYIVNKKQNVKVELLKVGNLNISQPNLNKYTFCYNNLYTGTLSPLCEACCCTDTIEVYATTNDLSLLPTLYLDINGINIAPSGYYNLIGSTQSYYYNYIGVQLSQISCSTCNCTPLLYTILVCIDIDLIPVCCCSSPGAVVYANNFTIETSTQIWSDPGGTIPLSPYLWIKEVGGNAVQVGADGHTVVQFNNCSGIIC